MADRRMFSKTIIDSDTFLDMPLSAQALYFHLSMRADDDGFINNPKKIQRMIGASDDDCRLLIMKQLIIAFDSGVIVIKHWRLHNYIQKDRYKPTLYQNEKSALELDESKVYTKCIQDVSNMDTQVRLGKVRLGKVKESEDKPHSQKKSYGEFKNVLLTDDEYNLLVEQFGNPNQLIKRLDEYKEQSGKQYNSDFMAIKNWVVEAVKEDEAKRPPIDETYNINDINRKAMLNDDYEI
ncbi:replisome organizer [Eubacterium sp.]